MDQLRLEPRRGCKLHQIQQHRILFQRQRQHKQVNSTRMRWRLRRINRQWAAKHLLFPHQSNHPLREMMRQWSRRGQKVNDSVLWLVCLCVLSSPVDEISIDEIPVNFVATHEIDHRPVYDHKTGERLPPHLVKVGRQTEHDAMIRHQMFERVPITKARGKKVRCQWLDEMNEAVKGSFVRNRLVAMEVAHGARFDTFAGTAFLKCISRSASIKNVRGQRTNVLALYDISVAFWHALLPNNKPIAMYPFRGEEEAGYMWQMKRAMSGTTRASHLFQEHMTQRSRTCSAQGMSAGLSLSGGGLDGNPRR